VHIIGIDLGTTNSLVSYWTEDGAVIIPNGLGDNLTPSVVSIDDNGEILVGKIAKERLITHPHMSIATFKRYMGTSRTFQLGEKHFLPEELSAFIIRSLKADAEAYLGESISEAVISVPAYFNDAQRKATKRAGELAGIKVERLINEPTAAATAYGLHQKESETKFLIFDLGGGTFDVSIVELFENVMEVKAIAGDNYLGGEDFTELLSDLFMKHYQIDKNNLDEKSYALIRKQAEHCKRSLSQNKSGMMKCTMNQESLEWTIDYQGFQETAKSLISRLRHPVEKALRDSGMRVDELDTIILVGGATRMSIVHTLISKLLGRFPANSINCDEVVAIGAGIQAGMKARNVALREVVLTDVCPYTLGMEVVSRMNSGEYGAGHFAPIIERNTVIPVSRVERFSTVQDGQKEINIKIFQGESRLTKNNIKLGEFYVHVPPAPAGEQVIDVRYTYDINGILEVEAVVIETGIKKSIVIEDSPGSMSKEEIEKRLAALQSIKIHPRDMQQNKLLMARGERLYEESLGDMRMAIAMLLQKFEGVMNRQDEREIKKEAEILKEKLDKLEEGKEL